MCVRLRDALRKPSADAVAIFDEFADADASWQKQISFLKRLCSLVTIIKTNFRLHFGICSFSHATLVKTGLRVQPIFNIISAAGSANAVADAWQLSFADTDVDADTTFRTQSQTQNSRIHTSMILSCALRWREVSWFFVYLLKQL